MTFGRVSLAFVLLVAGGCGRSTRESPSAPAPQRDVITRAELLNSTQSELDLFQAISSLRPHFLAPPPGVRPASASSSVVVYVDGVRQAGLSTLRSIGSIRVEEVRYLGPVESRNKIGVTASGGAVMVTLFKPDKDRDPPHS